MYVLCVSVCPFTELEQFELEQSAWSVRQKQLESEIEILTERLTASESARTLLCSLSSCHFNLVFMDLCLYARL